MYCKAMFHRVLVMCLVWAGGAAIAVCQQDEPDQPPETPDLRQYGVAVQTVLEQPRQTPGELLEGALLLLDLGEPELAKGLFEQMMQANPDEATKAKLAEQFGTSRMLRLARSPSLGPSARSFVDTAIAAWTKRLRAPARLQGLVAQLASPNRSERLEASDGLLQAGSAAIPACLRGLIEAPADAGQRATILGILQRLAPESIDAMLAALDAEDPQFLADLIGLLGRLGVKRAIPYLLAPALADPNEQTRAAARQALKRIYGAVPSKDESRRALHRFLDRHLKLRLAGAASDLDPVDVWWWTDPQTTVVPLNLAATDAAKLVAARLADDLEQLAGAREAGRRLALLARFEGAALADAALRMSGEAAARATLLTAPPLLAGVSTEDLNDVLSIALDRRLWGAAMRAAQLLGDRGDEGVLHSAAPEKSPLVRAITQKDRRLRFAALEALMKLDPQEAYPGASHVADALAYFATSTGQRKAVVASPRSQHAFNLAGELGSLGWSALPAARGRQAIAAALASPDVELLLIDQTTYDPGVREVIYQLRSDARTGGLAIGILASAEGLTEAKRIAAHDAATIAWVRPNDPAATVPQELDVDAPEDPPEEPPAEGAPFAGPEASSLQTLLDTLQQLGKRRGVAAEQRKAQADQATAWIARLASRRHGYYNLSVLEPALLSSLKNAADPKRSVAVLARVGSAESQQALLRLANRGSQPVEVRRLAAESFRQSVQRFGLGVTQSQIRRQYKLYKANAADPDARAILNSLLDTIEGKTSLDE